MKLEELARQATTDAKMAVADLEPPQILSNTAHGQRSNRPRLMVTMLACLTLVVGGAWGVWALAGNSERPVEVAQPDSDAIAPLSHPQAQDEVVTRYVSVAEAEAAGQTVNEDFLFSGPAGRFWIAAESGPELEDDYGFGTDAYGEYFYGTEVRGLPTRLDAGFGVFDDEPFSVVVAESSTSFLHAFSDDLSEDELVAELQHPAIGSGEPGPESDYVLEASTRFRVMSSPKTVGIAGVTSEFFLDWHPQVRFRASVFAGSVELETTILSELTDATEVVGIGRDKQGRMLWGEKNPAASVVIIWEEAPGMVGVLMSQGIGSTADLRPIARGVVEELRRQDGSAETPAELVPRPNQRMGFELPADSELSTQYSYQLPEPIDEYGDLLLFAEDPDDPLSAHILLSLPEAATDGSWIADATTHTTLSGKPLVISRTGQTAPSVTWFDEQSEVEPIIFADLPSATLTDLAAGVNLAEAEPSIDGFSLVGRVNAVFAEWASDGVEATAEGPLGGLAEISTIPGDWEHEAKAFEVLYPATSETVTIRSGRRAIMVIDDEDAVSSLLTPATIIWDGASGEIGHVGFMMIDRAPQDEMREAVLSYVEDLVYAPVTLFPPEAVYGDPSSERVPFEDWTIETGETTPETLRVVAAGHTVLAVHRAENGPTDIIFQTSDGDVCVWATALGVTASCLTPQDRPVYSVVPSVFDDQTGGEYTMLIVGTPALVEADDQQLFSDGAIQFETSEGMPVQLRSSYAADLVPVATVEADDGSWPLEAIAEFESVEITIP